MITRPEYNKDIYFKKASTDLQIKGKVMLQQTKRVLANFPDFSPVIQHFNEHQKISTTHLMTFFERYQTARIKPLVFKDSFAPLRIPLSFECLIPEIFNIIEQNFKTISLGKAYIGVFGLQPSCAWVKNDPLHFYCTLLYLPLSEQELKTVTHAQDAKNLMIDFHNGHVISPEQYLLAMRHHAKITPENAYGQLSADRLALAWQSQPCSYEPRI